MPRAADLPVVERVADGHHGDHGRVLAVWSGHAEGERHLLQEDDHGDADGEALDHRPGHVGEEPAETEEREAITMSDAGDQPDHDSTASAP